MTRKGGGGANLSESEKRLIYESFAGPLRERLPVLLWQPITINATANARRTIRSGAAASGDVGKIFVGNRMPGAACSGWNEGVGEHVRTRSHRAESRR